MVRTLAVGVLTVGLAGCRTGQAGGIDSLTAEGLASHIETLASDAFEGRRPASPGEERTVAYLHEQFERIGLDPGNGDSWDQPVPLVAITAANAPALTFRGRTGTRTFAYGPEQVVWSKRVRESVAVDGSELVFVGYGVVAPEYGWDDYQGVDVRGKTVIILVNDPGFATKDTALFQGETMTYYGRWTYKYEEAARQGAAAALIVHQTEPAAYPWDVVESSWTGPQFDLVRDDDNMSRVAVEGWVTLDVARQIFSGSGRDFDDLEAAAAHRGFRAIPLGTTVSVAIHNTLERSNSRNVAGVLRGRERPDEYIIYMAHWDHFGRDTTLAGDQIYNGALDNASGTAGLLALAEAFATRADRPARSILFLAVTAEEQGLLGSAYYAAHPLVPTAQTVAAINMDGLNLLGPMRDITVVGYGKSELDDYLTAAMEAAGRRVRSDPEPEKGFYYRSDHFSLAKVGVPALYTDAGIDNVEHGEAWTIAQRDDYTANRYHKPSDEYDPGWDLSGAIDDLKILYRVGEALTETSDWPNWRPGTEFRAIREADRAGR